MGDSKMSIRLIAKDLYRLQRDVETLEKEIQKAPIGNRGEMEDQLRKLRAGRDRLQRMLDGAKEPPSCKKPR